MAAASVVLAPLLALAVAAPADAASSKGCVGGGYTLVGPAGPVASAGPRRFRGTIAASRLGESFLVKGRYNQFRVRAADFAVLDYAFTGAPNVLDMTGGRFTPVFASKTPHHGVQLTGGVTARLDDEVLRLERSGPGMEMKIQAKDCAQGGIFQMEPEREDGRATRITHVLAHPGQPFEGAPAGAPYPFYFDNPFFRARAGQMLGSGCAASAQQPAPFCVRVTPRVNIANDASPAFVARDSAQVAVRVPQPLCRTAVPVTPTVDHCGAVSVWDVAPGGRMGFVSGEDAVEVANPPTECVQDCRAQNQVRGRLVVLGYPFPVPAGSRLVPTGLPAPAR